MEKEKLFNEMSDKLADYELSFREDGESGVAALNAAHLKIKEKYGAAAYEEFETWLNLNCAGPEG